MSPGNTMAELEEKRSLYFDAGAHEVWVCSLAGIMTFRSAQAARPQRRSGLCPEFPRQIELR
jgi:hypothetical protein